MINDSIFIIDTNIVSEYNESYVLRFNREYSSNNLLFPNYNLDYDFNNIMKIDWVDKKNKIYVNRQFISDELYDKLMEKNDDKYDFEEVINYENINEYKYVLYEETLKSIENEVDLLRFNTILIKIKLNNKEELDTFYSEYINQDHVIYVELEDYSNIDIISETKEKVKLEECKKKINNLNEKVNHIFSQEIINNYLKNLLSRLSLKCVSEKLISKKVFNTNRNSNYLYNRIEIEDNKFDFNFQGKDFDIMIKDGENKINILVNEFVTNIFYNNKNIFNYRIVGLVNNNQSSNYLFIVRTICYIYIKIRIS